MGRACRVVLGILGFVAVMSGAYADEPVMERARPADLEGAKRGWEALTHMTYQLSTLNKAILENLWRTWEPEYREQARKASPEERRRMTFDRYGFVEAPYDNHGAPLGYSVGSNGGYHFQCLLCHAGKVMGKPYIGAPNRDIDFVTLFEDMAKITPLPNSVFEWAGYSKGTVNSTDFVAANLEFRDFDMNRTPIPNGIFDLHSHEDLDILPWWNAKKKDAPFGGCIRRIQLALFYDGGPQSVCLWRDLSFLASDV